MTSMTETAERTKVSPMDIHNQILVNNVYPSDWVNPEPAPRYNLVVIGAGTAGLVTAAGAAGLGAKVALIEKHLLGGDCLNVGCVPSKCLIRSSRVFAELRAAHQFGYEVKGSKINFGAVMERMRRLRAQISHHDSAKRFKELGVDLFFGEARFSGSDRIEVAGKSLRFAKAVIATGARASAPPITGLNESGYLTNETVFSLTELPQRLAVIGAGPIGCELAQAFARFGSQVFLFEAMHGIMPNEDQDAASVVKRVMMQDGIQLYCCGKNLKIEKELDGKRITIDAKKQDKGKRITVDSHDHHYDLIVDEILVGVGRRPNIEGLNLESAGVEYDKTGVKVNDYLQTANPNIFAAGDICMKWKFTHAADAAARIVIQNALFFKSKKLSALTMPWCTYTDPEIAHVGMYEKEAKEKGIEVETFLRQMNEVDRAVADGEEDGFVKVHVKKGTDKILGATVVASHAGEMINELSLAIVAKIGLGTIANVIHSYPTQAEAIKQVGDAYNRTRLTPTVKKLFNRWLAWRRSEG